MRGRGEEEGAKKRQRGRRRRRESDGEMKVEEGRTMEKIIKNETEAGERWSNSRPWPRGPPASHVLILQINCIDFIPLMW